MFDINLAIIDAAIAWVVVMPPRFAQARLLAHWKALGYGEEERLRFDPVQHMSVTGTLAVPAATSLLRLPVLAWGKDFDETPHSPNLRYAMVLVAAVVLAYLLQAVALMLFMHLVAHVYFPGAPVAGRAGQLCLRMAMLNLLAIPILDAGEAWRFLPGYRWPRFARWILGAAILSALWFTGGLIWIDQTAALLFFRMSSWG